MYFIYVRGEFDIEINQENANACPKDMVIRDYAAWVNENIKGVRDEIREKMGYWDATLFMEKKHCNNFALSIIETS